LVRNHGCTLSYSAVYRFLHQLVVDEVADVALRLVAPFNSHQRQQEGLSLVGLSFVLRGQQHFERPLSGSARTCSSIPTKLKLPSVGRKIAAADAQAQ
jgi:hypothetical protein